MADTPLVSAVRAQIANRFALENTVALDVAQAPGVIRMLLDDLRKLLSEHEELLKKSSIEVTEEHLEWARRHEYMPPIGSVWTYRHVTGDPSSPMVLQVTHYGVNSGMRTIHTSRWFRQAIPLQDCLSLEDEFAPRDGMRMGHFCNMMVAGRLKRIA